MAKTPPRRFKDAAALRKAVREEALARWNDPKVKRPAWDMTLTPVEFSGPLATPAAVAGRLAKLSLSSRRAMDTDEIEQDVCERALADAARALQDWLPMAKDTLDVVSRKNGARLRDLVELVEAVPVREAQKLRRQVADYVTALLAPRKPTPQEMTWASLLCGVEVEADPKKGTLVSAVFVKETRAMRWFCK